MFGVGGGGAPVVDRPPVDGDPYARHKERASLRQRSQSRDAREIAPDFPRVVNPRRKAKALADFKFFCRAYFPDIFYLPFSKDHQRVIDKAESAAKDGGQFAMAMPRGSGKTAICVALCLWVILKGLHQVVMLIGATKTAATEMLDGIKISLATNEILFADFPEVCYPIHRLEGVNQRRLLWNGELIRQESKKESLIFPSLPPNPASSACIVVRGITGRIRGFKITRPDGREERPTMSIVDDPQTNKSAKSPNQCDNRERIANGDIMGLAGPDKPIAVLIPCTVIYPNDFADRILDQDRNPQYSGERLKLVYEWPKGPEADGLWEEYGMMYRQALREKRPVTAANAFYRKHRKAMDTGHRVAWPERKYPGTISAIQHAMNLRFRVGAEAFDAEYQNSPRKTTLEEEIRLDPDEIANKVNNLERGIVPVTATKLVSFIDVNEKVLAYSVVGWGSEFSGGVVDYGAYPDQGRLYWTKADAERSYADLLPGAGKEAQLYAALQALTEQILGRTWTRDGGTSALSIGLCLIDSGYMTDLVFKFCRESRFRNILLPSKGKGIPATGTAITEYQKRDGDEIGEGYKVSINATTKRAIPSVLFDTNHWKSFAEARFRTPAGGRGSLALYGDGPLPHRMFGDHVSAEHRVRAFAMRSGRTVDEWKDPADGRDNEWWDCIVGCCVAGHKAGARLLEEAVPLQAPAARTVVRMPTAHGHSSFFITDRR